MAITYCCPIHHEPLDTSDPERWIGVDHRQVYPVRKNIPILLADEAERFLVPDYRSPAESAGRKALDFYNDVAQVDEYLKNQEFDERREVEKWFNAHRVDGPTLEIGSGKGMMQGIGEERGQYVAIDYSYTALARHIAPKYDRACASAENLPFFDNTFSCLFTVNVLEHVPNAAKAFEEIHRVLKPGGIAYLSPAWHCVQYNCEGIPVRPYSDLTLFQKLTKFSLPLRRLRLIKALAAVPRRTLRRILWAIHARPTSLHYRRLKPSYDKFWMADSDAVCRIDAHEGALFFTSRKYEMLQPPGGVWSQLLLGHQPVVVRKPVSFAIGPLPQQVSGHESSNIFRSF